MSIAAISRFVLRHKLMVAIIWLVVAVVAFASTGAASSALSQEFNMPESESTKVNDAIVATYGRGELGRPLVAVVDLPDGITADSPQVEQELGAMLDEVRQIAPDARVASYLSTDDQAFVSEDGSTTFALIYPSVVGSQPPPHLDAIRSVLANATVAGTPIHVTGIGELESGGGGEGGSGVLIETLIGGAGALIVLLWVFGSFLALVPLLIAAIAIVTTYLLIWGLTTVTDVSMVVQFLIALIGLGVAIDYSLLIVTRWREERATGRNNQDAVQHAMETAGHAVIFSGTTVAIGLLALVALPVPFLRSIGYGGMLIPLVSVAVSITLLPVILATVGPRLEWPRLRSGNQVSQLWERWTRGVVRHHVLAATVSLIILAALIIPTFSIDIGYPRAESLASGGEAHAGLIALEESGIGSGALTPFVVLAEESDPAEVESQIEEIEGIARVAAPQGDGWNTEGSSILLAMPPTDDNSANASTLGDMRNAVDDLAGTVLVGGFPATNMDFIDAVYSSFPLMVGLIIVITFVLLVRAFRSLLLPLKAIVLNILSVAAAYGVVVLVWQMGYGSELIWGIEPTGSITNWLPIAIFAFLFGLSMDYEVFIMSRMREERDAGHTTDESVIRGMSHTGKLVTTAALILFLAFVALAAVPQTTIKIMATGLAAGILLDATIVRAMLVPAAVSLMGRWNWWLPGWLERFAATEPTSAASVSTSAPEATQ